MLVRQLTSDRRRFHIVTIADAHDIESVDFGVVVTANFQAPPAVKDYGSPAEVIGTDAVRGAAGSVAAAVLGRSTPNVG